METSIRTEISIYIPTLPCEICRPCIVWSGRRPKHPVALPPLGGGRPGPAPGQAGAGRRDRRPPVPPAAAVITDMFGGDRELGDLAGDGVQHFRVRAPPPDRRCLWAAAPPHLARHCGLWSQALASASRRNRLCCRQTAALSVVFQVPHFVSWHSRFVLLHL